MSPAGRSRPWAILKQLVPYLIAAGALAWVLHKTDLDEMMRAFRHAPITLFIAVSAVALFVNCMADVYAMSKVFGWFGCRVQYWDLFLVRASTYLVAIVNYHVGQAAIVGYLYKSRKVPLLRASGWILFIIGINVGTLFLLASAGASQASGALERLRLVPLVCGIGVVGYSALLVLKPRVLAERALLAPLFEMGIAGHVKALGVRLPHIGVLLLWHFFSLRAFGIAVTPEAALLYLPAYFAVSSVPLLSVNGLGMSQVVAVQFFSRFVAVAPGVADVAGAQKAAVIAYSLGTSGVSILLQVVLGVVCLRRGAALGLGARAVDVDGPPNEVASS